MQKQNIKVAKNLDKQIENLKDELKKFIRLQVKADIDSEVYNEEYIRLTSELEEARRKRKEFDKDDAKRSDLKNRFDEIIHTLNSRDELLEEFDENIFNAPG